VNIPSKYTYSPSIGLEVHIQLLTKSKIFSPDACQYGAEPNSLAGEITLAHPGTLPKLNKKVIELAIKLGLACNSEISREVLFDRKNYFYPDLPKGYQLTQDKYPICKGGEISIESDNGKLRSIPIQKIHLEEDAGKSVHKDNFTLIDFNRSGVPLLELVTTPELNTPMEAYNFLSEIRKLVRYLGISDGNMEEGSLRCDANVSIKQALDEKLGNKVEIKNLNSFRFVQKALEFEIQRQVEQKSNGKEIIQETRRFDEKLGQTFGMRKKEAMNDYRYFPEPDLSPVIITQEWIEEVKKSMHPLPSLLKEKYVEEYNLSEYDAGILTQDIAIVQLFEKLSELTQQPKPCANWIIGPVKSYLNKNKIPFGDFSINIETFADLINRVVKGDLSFSLAANRIFPILCENPDHPLDLVLNKQGIGTINELTDLENLISQVVSSHPAEVENYRAGKKKLIGFFMGEIIKKSKGSVDPGKARKLLVRFLGIS